MARPRLGEKKRSIPLTVYFNVAEWRALQKRADGLKPAVYVRNSSLGISPPARRKRTQDVLLRRFAEVLKALDALGDFSERKIGIVSNVDHIWHAKARVLRCYLSLQDDTANILRLISPEQAEKLGEATSFVKSIAATVRSGQSVPHDVLLRGLQVTVDAIRQLSPGDNPR